LVLLGSEPKGGRNGPAGAFGRSLVICGGLSGGGRGSHRPDYQRKKEGKKKRTLSSLQSLVSSLAQSSPVSRSSINSISQVQFQFPVFLSILLLLPTVPSTLFFLPNNTPYLLLLLLPTLVLWTLFGLSVDLPQRLHPSF
jgi:hypothetical protein